MNPILQAIIAISFGLVGAGIVSAAWIMLAAIHRKTHADLTRTHNPLDRQTVYIARAVSYIIIVLVAALFLTLAFLIIFP